MKTRGLDLTVDYGWSTDVGNFNTNLAVTWIDKFTTQFDENSDPVENISLGALPEMRINLVQGWNSEDLERNHSSLPC